MLSIFRLWRGFWRYAVVVPTKEKAKLERLRGYLAPPWRRLRRIVGRLASKGKEVVFALSDAVGHLDDHDDWEPRPATRVDHVLRVGRDKDAD